MHLALMIVLISYSLGIICIRMIELVWLVITYIPLAHPCYTNERSILIYYGYELVTWNRVSLLSVFLGCNQHFCSCISTR